MMKKYRFFIRIISIIFILIVCAISVITAKYSNTNIEKILEWKKGPLIDPFFPFSAEKVSTIFVVSVISSIVLYVIFSGVVKYILVKQLQCKISFWKVILLHLVLSIAVFSLVEAGVRNYLKTDQGSLFRPHPVLFWRVKSNLDNFINLKAENEIVSTNSLGLRGREVSFHKKKNEFRVVVLGDSSNFGIGVNDSQTWEYDFEAMLRESFPAWDITVINGACPGYTTYGGLMYLKQTALRFKPDILIIGFNNDECKDYLEDKNRVKDNRLVLKIKTFAYKSDFYLVLRQVILSIKLAVSNRSHVYENKDLPLISRVSLEDYKKNIREFIEIGRIHDIPVIFLNMPVNRTFLERDREFSQRYYNAVYRRSLKELCDEYSQILVDIDKDWLSSGREDLFKPPMTPFHPNPEGHRLIAMQIYDRMIKEKLLDKNVKCEINFPEK